jgi:hypothetical protein
MIKDLGMKGAVEMATEDLETADIRRSRTNAIMPVSASDYALASHLLPTQF